MKKDFLQDSLLARLFHARVDERIYALVRMGLAFAALWSLVEVWPLRTILLSNEGALPLEAAAEHSEMCTVLLFHFFQTQDSVTLLMLLAGFAMVMLMAGVLPRLAALAVFLWQMSLMERAPMAATGWDMLLRSFSFLVLISPMGRCWALPAWLGWAQARADLVPRYGLVLIRLQVLALYWQTVWLKLANPNPYWRNGEFLPYFMMSEYSRWAGAWAAEHADLLVFGTWAALLAELAVPVLLFIRKTRFYGMALGLLLHGLISVAAPDISPFMVAMAATYTAFLTGEDARRLGAGFTALAGRLSAGR